MICVTGEDMADAASMILDNPRDCFEWQSWRIWQKELAKRDDECLRRNTIFAEPDSLVSKIRLSTAYRLSPAQKSALGFQFLHSRCRGRIE